MQRLQQSAIRLVPKVVAEGDPQPADVQMPELTAMRDAQQSWARSSWAQRRKTLRGFRVNLAARAEQVAQLMPLSLIRSHAETLGAEILPLLDACKFLETDGEEILRTERFGTHRLPLWLTGIHSEIPRDPLGIVLIIAPSNYPLFLAGVQALQALAAGNACIWKPADGCEAVAHAMRQCLLDAGLAPELFWVTGSSVETAKQLLGAGVDKVFLTGSVSTGQSVLGQLATSVTPAVMELSGCDAVFVLPGADLARVTKALAFGTRLNGSATCIAPRRVFVPRKMMADLEPRLLMALREIPAIPINATTQTLLEGLLEDAQIQGARLALDGREARPLFGPFLLVNANENMLVTRTDIFAPVLALMPFDSQESALQMYASCPLALSAAIFGPERDARALSHRLLAGTVILNDLIAPTVDPRVCFGGRGASGYGVTRGRDGLLEMTAPKVILAQRAWHRLHYEKTTKDHLDLFVGLIQSMHGKGWRSCVDGWARAMRAGLRIGKHVHRGADRAIDKN